MTLSNLYYLIVSLQMETENVADRSNNISVSIGLQNVMDRHGTDQKAIRYNGNIGLEINENPFILDPVEKCINKYKFHPSILLIKNRIKIQNLFSFHAREKNDMMRELLKVDQKKKTTWNSIQYKTLKLRADISADILQNLFNDMLSTGNFPGDMKLADIRPVFKKKDPLKKVNYRPASILSAFSKIFERTMQKQIVGCMKTFLSSHLCGCRKNLNTQQALLALIENWKKSP